MEPVTAIQMATLNVAEHFGLDRDLGGIAPGKCADLVVIPDIRTVEAQMVLCKGKVMAKKGTLLKGLPNINYQEQIFKSVNISLVKPEDFKVFVPADIGEISVRAIEMVTDIVNREAAITLPVKDGVASVPATADVLKAAVFDRFEGGAQRAVGFIKGYGMGQGALAASFSFDEGNLVVIGCNDDDMAAAVNRIRELQGGIVYCIGGEVTAEIPLPILGGISELTGPKLALELAAFIKVLKRAGCKGKNPLLTLFTLTFTAIPSLRLLSRGYWLSKESRVVDYLL